jgi:hypothetical protein
MIDRERALEEALRDLLRVVAPYHPSWRAIKDAQDALTALAIKPTPENDPALAKAADAFRSSLLSRADGMEHGLYPLWHGWALFDAFVAGAKWQSLNRRAKPHSEEEK